MRAWIAGLVAVAHLLAAPAAHAYCVNSRRWGSSPHTFIPVFVLDHPTRGLNDDTIGLNRDTATAQIMAAMQRWNEAGTGAKRLVFAGFIGNPDPNTWSDNSITVVALPLKDLSGSIASFGVVEEGTRRGRLALRHRSTAWKWDTNPDVPANNLREDIQSTTVHELGHALGLGHPWLAADVNSEVEGAARNRCSVAAGPPGLKPGATIGAMTYISVMTGSNSPTYPRQGSQRFPWRDDIEGATIANGQSELTGESCTRADDCDVCPPGRTDCAQDELACVTDSGSPCSPAGSCPNGSTCEREQGDSCNPTNAVCPEGFVCDPLALRCIEERGTCSSSACEDDSDCAHPARCERSITGVDGDGSGLERCDADSDCPEDFGCDRSSGFCLADQGRCVQRSCVAAFAEPHRVAYWTPVSDSMSAPMSGPFAVPSTSHGFFRTIVPPSASAADDFDNRRITVVGVDPRRHVRYQQALDGTWCQEIENEVVAGGANGRTYAMPVTAHGAGKTIVAWLANERFDSFAVRVRFAIKDSFGQTWDTVGEVGLPGEAKSISLGYAEKPNRFVLGYLDRRADGRIRMIHPGTGEVSKESNLVKGLSGQDPLNDIGRASCHDDDCSIALTHAGGGLPFGVMDGEVTTEGFEANEWGEPPFFKSSQNIGQGERALRGNEAGRVGWFTHLQAHPLGAGAGIAQQFILGNGVGSIPLPWFGGGTGPQLDDDDTSPLWSVGMGTYAQTFSNDSQRAMVFRGVGRIDGIDPWLIHPPQMCCTPSDCGPVGPEDDPELTNCSDLSEEGTVGCPCAPITTSSSAVESCALAGLGPGAAVHCEPIQPDGRFPDKYCADGTGPNGLAVVCDATQAGNSICRECGEAGGGAFGCPCNEVDCASEDLGCWGDAWASPAAPDPSLGRCWEQEKPPDWVCVEICDRLAPSVANGYKLVCVGPHLGDFYEDGSMYHLTNGELAGHPSFCTAVDCTNPVEPVEGGYCEAQSSGGQVCIAEDECGVECVLSEECHARGYPAWYACTNNRCLPISACDGKASGC